MRTPVRLSLFAVGLVSAFAAAAALGNVTGPIGPAAATDRAASAVHGGMGGTDEPEEVQAAQGLTAAQDGYRLEVDDTAFVPGVPGPLSFRVLQATGAPLTTYTRQHDKDLHLIVVRRDLADYQHVHPTLGPDGSWSMPLTLPRAGVYRMYADFVPPGEASSVVLGADLVAPGDFAPVPLTPPTTTTSVDGYDVVLAGALTAGRTSALDLRISRAGVPVTDLQPYLGSFGHLVAMRVDDLAYLHVHPERSASAGPELPFAVDLPTAANYRLFLDFRHGDAVHTAAFTVTAQETS